MAKTRSWIVTVKKPEMEKLHRVVGEANAALTGESVPMGDDVALVIECDEKASKAIREAGFDIYPNSTPDLM